MAQFDNFTERARTVLLSAQAEARRCNHSSISPEHLLLGLIRDRSDVAARALSEMKVGIGKLRAMVEFTIGLGDEVVPADHLDLTPRAQKVLEVAIDESRRLGHDLVDTHHLLLAIIREGEGSAATLLKGLGVDLDKAEAQVLEILASIRAASAGGPQ